MGVTSLGPDRKTRIIGLSQTFTKEWPTLSQITVSITEKKIWNSNDGAKAWRHALNSWKKKKIHTKALKLIVEIEK